ncbi:MAG: hypothetical protein PSV35_08485, partial [bacterium]|nr:hypothetical protein [bacterium]
SPVFGITELELMAFEKNNYEKTLAAIQPMPNQNNSLHAAISKAIHSINNEVNQRLNENKSVDYLFYTQTLSDFKTLLIKPQDSVVINHLAILAASASGKPSLGQKVVGAILAVLGVLLMAASIAGLVFSLGSSSFLSAFGASLGFSLLASQISVGVIGSLATATSAGITLWGCNHFKSGMRQGLSKELIEVQDEVVAQTGIELSPV